MIERSRVRILVGAAESLYERRDNVFLQGQLSVLILISVSVPTAVLPQYHVTDPGHSAKIAGGRLELNIYARTLRMWLRMK